MVNEELDGLFNKEGSPQIQKPLVVFEIANNHNGDVNHGLKIIHEIDSVCKEFKNDFIFAFKFQYRDIDSFIHPDFKNRKDISMARKIELSRGEVTIVDNFDYLWLGDYKWSFSGGYAVRVLSVKLGEVESCYNTKTVYMHKEIMKFYGLIGEKGDHKNRNKLDNRKENLRPSTNQQNCWNNTKPKGNHSSKYKGVDWYSNKEKWRSRIGGTKLLGYYENEVDAALAYDVAALYYRGEFASLNFPKEIRKDHLKVGGINIDNWKEYKKIKTCIYDGIVKDMRYKNKFYAKVCYNGRTEHLGTFNNALRAAFFRERYIKENGLNCRLNFA